MKGSENGFKETELGPLPEDWKVVKLGEVCEVIMGQSPPGKTYNTEGNGMPFLQGKAEFGNIYPTHIKYTTQPLKIAPPNTVLISVRAPVGDVNLADIAYCIGRGLASLSMRNGNNTYLFYCLEYLKPLLEKQGTGSTFMAINKSKLEKFPIPLPPLSEQERIAGVLSAIQGVIEKTERVIRANRELKRSLMKHLFTYGPVPVNNVDSVKLKDTEIGKIPEHWNVVKLGEVCDVKSGGTPSKKKREYWENGNIPWIRSEKCQDCFIDKVSDFITESGLENSSAKIFGSGTVLVAMVGATLGKTGYLKIPASTNQNIAGLFPTVNNLIGLFLFYCMQSRYKFFSKEGGYKIANLSFIKSFPIPLPPLSEQGRIAEVLSAVDEKIQAEERKKRALEGLFKSMLHHLMTGKIRVKDLNIEV